MTSIINQSFPIADLHHKVALLLKRKLSKTMDFDEHLCDKFPSGSNSIRQKILNVAAGRTKYFMPETLETILKNINPPDNYVEIIALLNKAINMYEIIQFPIFDAYKLTQIIKYSIKQTSHLWDEKILHLLATAGRDQYYIVSVETAKEIIKFTKRNGDKFPKSFYDHVMLFDTLELPYINNFKQYYARGATTQQLGDLDAKYPFKKLIDKENINEIIEKYQVKKYKFNENTLITTTGTESTIEGKKTTTFHGSNPVILLASITPEQRKSKRKIPEGLHESSKYYKCNN